MFRFRVRDILWIMIVVGLSIALYSAQSDIATYKYKSVRYERLFIALYGKVEELGCGISIATGEDEVPHVRLISR